MRWGMFPRFAAMCEVLSAKALVQFWKTSCCPLKTQLSTPTLHSSTWLLAYVETIWLSVKCFQVSQKEKQIIISDLPSTKLKTSRKGSIQKKATNTPAIRRACRLTWSGFERRCRFLCSHYAVLMWYYQRGPHVWLSGGEWAHSPVLCLALEITLHRCSSK